MADCGVGFKTYLRMDYDLSHCIYYEYFKGFVDALIQVAYANNEFAANVIINKVISEMNFVFMMLRLGFDFLTQIRQIRLQSYA